MESMFWIFRNWQILPSLLFYVHFRAFQSDVGGARRIVVCMYLWFRSNLPAVENLEIGGAFFFFFKDDAVTRVYIVRHFKYF